MRGLVLLGLLLMAGMARADGLSEAVLRVVREDPAPFLQLASDLIHGFGSDQGIDAAGIDRFVALERAAARASALRRLQVADLDFDGAVTGPEMAVLAAAAAAKSRGRLWDVMEKADGNGDGTVSGNEMQLWARGEALRGFSAEKEALARGVLGFDGNADGRVTLDEVRAALVALGI